MSQSAGASGSAPPGSDVLAGKYSYASVTDKIAGVVLQRPSHWGWWLGLGLSGALTLLFLVSIAYLMLKHNEPYRYAKLDVIKNKLTNCRRKAPQPTSGRTQTWAGACSGA